MTSTSTDRRQGVNSGVAIKVPCRVATTANIALTALQTIDGIVLAAGDRVLVKNQTAPGQNGIYNADTGAWTRAIDFDGNLDVTCGTLVIVTDGTLSGDLIFQLTTANPITIGTTGLAFAAVALYQVTVSPFMLTVLDDADATAARNTLGVGPAQNVTFADVITSSGFVKNSTDNDIQFATPTGGTQLRAMHVANAVNYVSAYGAAAGSGVAVRANGANANIPLLLGSKGTGTVEIQSAAGAYSNFIIDGSIAAVVNQLTAYGAPTGNPARLGASGADTNIGLNIDAKGSGGVALRTAGGNATVLQALDGTAGNNFTMAPAVAGAAAVLATTSGGIQITPFSTFGTEIDNKLTVIATTFAGLAAEFQNTNSTSPLGIKINYTVAAPNDTAKLFLECKDSSAQRAAIRSNGGFANFSANDANLSDARLKKDIQAAGSYYDAFRRYEIVTYLYKDQTDTALNLGVIAQQIESISPELVDAGGWGDAKIPKVENDAMVMQDVPILVDGQPVMIDVPTGLLSPRGLPYVREEVATESVPVMVDNPNFAPDGIPMKAIYQTDFQFAMARALQETIEKLETLSADFATYKAAHP